MRQLKKILLSYTRSRVIRAGLQAFIITVLGTASTLLAADQDQIESMRQSVFALDSARQTALSEIGTTSLSPDETEDYKDFIVYLNTRIVNYCTELAEQGGDDSVDGLPCPEAQGTGLAANEQAPTEETFIYVPVYEPEETHTQAEKTASMDKQLFAALGEFDELLLKEEEKVSSRVPSQRESGGFDQGDGTSGEGGAGSGTGESGDGTGERDGSDATSADAGESDSSSAQSGQTAQGGTASGTHSGAGAGDADIDHSAYGAPGGKLPPPQDDDIVARQLREAAEKETDPELKKKLWEEYWKYKGVKKGA
jgi:hypothetical protein